MDKMEQMIGVLNSLRSNLATTAGNIDDLVSEIDEVIRDAKDTIKEARAQEAKESLEEEAKTKTKMRCPCCKTDPAHEGRLCLDSHGKGTTGYGFACAQCGATWIVPEGHKHLF